MKNINSLIPTIPNGMDLVEYYQEVYKDKIRPVDEKWVLSQRGKYEGNYSYMSYYANHSKVIFNSYTPYKGAESKRTFVLWKLDSICACLGKYGYCASKNCDNCPVQRNANEQLKLIDQGLDEPKGVTKSCSRERITSSYEFLIERKDGRYDFIYQNSKNHNKYQVDLSCIYDTMKKISDTCMDLYGMEVIFRIKR